MYTNERNYCNHILSHGNSMSDLNSVYMCEYFQSELQTVAQVGPGQWQVHGMSSPRKVFVVHGEGGSPQT